MTGRLDKGATPDVVPIGSKEGNLLIRELRDKGELTLFVGSGISRWKPTSIPTGQAVTDHIGELMLRQFRGLKKKERREIKEAITGTPFEYIWEQIPDLAEIRDMLLETFRDRPPNPIHEAIRDLLVTGVVKHVITTNYDTCLDDVFRGIKDLREVTTRKNAKAILESDRIYFKIHGSAKKGMERSIVYRLSHEGTLPEWKRDVLSRCVTSSQLLVIGYSGLDFEICPELAHAAPSRVIWNCFSDPLSNPRALSPNAARVVRSGERNIVLWGDMARFFSLIAGGLPKLVPSNAVPGWDLESILSKPELQVWACSVISPLGYGLQAQKLAGWILDTIDNKSKHLPKAYFLLGDALFHRGKYLQSAEQTTIAASQFSNSDDMPGFVASVSRQADALRCAGHFWDSLLEISRARSRMAVSTVSSSLRKRLVTELDLKELLVYRDFYEIANWLGNKRLARTYQSYGRSLIRKIAAVAAKEGIWNVLQQSRMWAGRLDIDFGEIYKGSMQPLDDLQGFAHLGAIIPQMMAMRDSLLRGQHGAEEVAERLPELIERANAIGCFPEIWKLGLAYNESLDPRSVKSPLEWEGAFGECEYTEFLRKFKLANPRHR